MTTNRGDRRLLILAAVLAPLPIALWIVAILVHGFGPSLSMLPYVISPYAATAVAVLAAARARKR